MPPTVAVGLPVASGSPSKQPRAFVVRLLLVGAEPVVTAPVSEAVNVDHSPVV